MNKSLFVSLIVIISGIVAAQQNFKADSIIQMGSANIPVFEKQLDDIFNDPNFATAHCGVTIQSLLTGEYFYKRNEDKLFVPASNMKLFTSAAGLTLLGKNYRFKTECYLRGKMDGSILNGDIILRGFGDPTISGRFYNDNVTQIFNNWADSLLEHGIDEIKGRIIGDDNAFDDVGLGRAWPWDDETDWYSAPSGALSTNDNCVDIFLRPTIPGEKAKLEYQPLTKYLTIIPNVLTVPRDSAASVFVYRERGTNVISVSGTIREGSDVAKYHSSVNNPTQFFINVFRDVLQRKGIMLNGFCADIDDLDESLDYTGAELLFTHFSEPMPDILKVINKNSQNFFAEQLLKTIAYEKTGFGSASTGLKILREYMESIGINTDNLSFADGSGLSRMNLISPKQITTLLEHMYRSDLFPEFYNSLSIAGVDGTLSKRMAKTRAEANFRGKTGYVGFSRCLSGFIQTADGEWLTVAMMVNNFTVPLKIVEKAQDLVCIRLANFSRR